MTATTADVVCRKIGMLAADQAKLPGISGLFNWNAVSHEPVRTCLKFDERLLTGTVAYSE